MGKEMFSYQLPDGGLRTHSFVNDQGQIKFDPPVYEQRYTTAVRILEDPCWKGQIKKVVDFGCAEMRLLPLIRRVKNVEHILEVDIDESLLKTFQHRAVPLISDHLQKRENPLRIEIFKGSIDASVENLRNVDAVVAIEIIEHLYKDTLDQVPQNIFGFMQPKLAIFSTPNSEFNVLFEPLLANGFRHWDHKFEWTRAQFKQWALDICTRYPNYSVSIMGVGMPPPDRKEIGNVSQIAIFARNDIIDRPLDGGPIVTDAPADPNPHVQYKEIFSVDYPFFRDERTKEEQIWEESQFHIQRYRRDNFLNKERCVYQLPFALIRVFTAAMATDDELRAVLRANDIEMEGEFIIMPELDENDRGFRHCDDAYDEDFDDDCWEEDLLASDTEYDDEISAVDASHHMDGDSEEENWDNQ